MKKLLLVVLFAVILTPKRNYAQQQHEVKIDTAILKRYVGKYKAFLTIEVIEKDGKLYRHRDSTADIELKPESDTKFLYADGSNRGLEFEVDSTGKVTRIWFLNNGQK